MIVVIVIVMVLPCLPALACLPARLPACLPVNLIRSHFGRSSNASANTGAKTSTNASAKQRIRSHGKLLLPLQTHFGHFESSRGVAGGAGTGAVSFDLRGARTRVLRDLHLLVEQSDPDGRPQDWQEASEECPTLPPQGE